MTTVMLRKVRSIRRRYSDSGMGKGNIMFTLEMDTSGAAFHWADDPGSEVAEVLRNVAMRLAIGQTAGNVLDANGNECGTWKLAE